MASVDEPWVPGLLPLAWCTGVRSLLFLFLFPRLNPPGKPRLPGSSSQPSALPRVCSVPSRQGPLQLQSTSVKVNRGCCAFPSVTPLALLTCVVSNSSADIGDSSEPTPTPL